MTELGKKKLIRLIDAEELVRDIHYEWNDVRVWDESGAATADEFERLVDSAPTIEERKKGKWIYSDNGDIIYDSYYCSCCHRYITVDAERKCDIGFIINDFDFCPYCGADMRG